MITSIIKTKTQKKKKEPLVFAEKKESTSQYKEALGGRKRAVARVRVIEDKKQSTAKSFMVNGRDVNTYFRVDSLRLIVHEPLNKVKVLTRFSVSVHVKGGGMHAQAEAIRHGLARALTSFNEEWKKKFKRSGYLKRDPREKERRKFGLKKARKAPQWSKR